MTIRKTDEIESVDLDRFMVVGQSIPFVKSYGIVPVFNSKKNEKRLVYGVLWYKGDLPSIGQLNSYFDDITDRIRNKTDLSPEEVSYGGFSLSSAGVRGSELGLDVFQFPIAHYPSSRSLIVYPTKKAIEKCFPNGIRHYLADIVDRDKTDHVLTARILKGI